MKNIVKIALVFGTVMGFVSCKNDKSPNYQYFPNMYESVAYEAYSESNAFNSPYGLDDKEGQLPPKNTIKRGFVPYEYPHTTEGYNAAKVNSKSPLDAASIDMTKAQELFDVYCAICHGTAGDGKGKLVKQEKFLGVPNYADREITEGSVYFVETYGLNAMGSHANQLSQKERWMVAAYVMKLRADLKK